MPSFRTVALAVAASLVSVARSDYWVEPSSVPLATRQNWCSDQEATCTIICEQIPPGSTIVNECDAEQLTYGCLCGNNMQPNVSEYTLTLPFHVCRAWQQQCADACGQGQNLCVASCTEDHPCGAQNPTRVNVTSSSTSAGSLTSETGAAEESGDVVFDGPDGQGGSGASGQDGGGPDGAAGALAVGRDFGLAIVGGSLFLGFALLL